MRRVLFITRVVQSYRAPFHERVRNILAAHDIDYHVIHGEDEEQHKLKGDTIRMPWAKVVPNRLIGAGRATLIWQPLLRNIRGADLLIIGQENKFLLNYLLQLLRRRLLGRVALWGHGRNFQARSPNSKAERWKRFWATRCDWWFGYTEETRRHLESLSYPPERITVFNNSVDTAELQRTATILSAEEIDKIRVESGIRTDNMAIFVGGLYADKEFDFLVKAADRVRELIPDFELLIIGGGPDRSKLDIYAQTRPWLIIAGPRYGREKVALMLAAKLFLMPGLVGLAVLDAAALGLPLVTTNYPYHSPEIAYLEHGVNGIIVADWQNPAPYGDSVAALMLDEKQRAKLTAGGKAMAERYTIDAMAERFVTGVLAALEAD